MRRLVKHFKSVRQLDKRRSTLQTNIVSLPWCQPTAQLLTPHSSTARRLTSRFLINRHWHRHQVASMSSRRSARISAATELKATLAPPSLMPPPPLPAPVKQSRKRKAVVDTVDTADTTTNVGVGVDVAEARLPKTPSPRKRRAPRASTPPPLATPTPSNAKLMGEPASDGIEPRTPEAKKPRARGVTRLAPPNATLATLVSPESSRIVTSKDATRAQSVSPMKQPPAPLLGAAPLLGPVAPLPKPPTTANILEEACRHLIAVDGRMKTLVDAHHCRVFSPEGLAEQIDPFESLCSGILSQQVSGAAAKAIKKRFVSLFYPEDAAAKEASEQGKGDWDDVVKTDPSTLR